ncbi:Uncharacterised protein [Vibrio cholerae]|nr:Uncharacterised protein [Vibrio cholerae]CSI46001.1 Uncharacterised protein [Vibrio cholerae]
MIASNILLAQFFKKQARQPPIDFSTLFIEDFQFLHHLCTPNRCVLSLNHKNEQLSR